RMEMAGIDFGWPTHARVAAITITKPSVEVERDASGAITLRELFVVDESDSQPSAAPKAVAESEPKRPKKPLSDDPRGGAVDIQGELRDFKLAQVNPYATSVVAWAVDRGKLGVKFRYHVERDQIEASNEIVVANLHVAPTPKEDEVKKRIGLPLGMIVALITD